MKNVIYVVVLLVSFVTSNAHSSVKVSEKKETFWDYESSYLQIKTYGQLNMNFRKWLLDGFNRYSEKNRYPYGRFVASGNKSIGRCDGKIYVDIYAHTEKQESIFFNALFLRYRCNAQRIGYTYYGYVTNYGYIIKDGYVIKDDRVEVLYMTIAQAFIMHQIFKYFDSKKAYTVVQGLHRAYLVQLFSVLSERISRKIPLTIVQHDSVIERSEESVQAFGKYGYINDYNKHYKLLAVFKRASNQYHHLISQWLTGFVLHTRKYKTYRKHGKTFFVYDTQQMRLLFDRYIDVFLLSWKNQLGRDFFVNEYSSLLSGRKKIQVTFLTISGLGF